MSDFAQLILMWIWLCVIRKLADANIPICYLHEFDVKVKAMQFCIKLSILFFLLVWKYEEKAKSKNNAIAQRGLCIDISHLLEK